MFGLKPRNASEPVRVRIQETNEIAQSLNTAVEYMSDHLPEWFKPLRYVVEDRGFTNMTLQFESVHYLITLAQESESVSKFAQETAQELSEAYTPGAKEIESAIQLLAGQMINFRTELLVIKGMLNAQGEQEREREERGRDRGAGSTARYFGITQEDIDKYGSQGNSLQEYLDEEKRRLNIARDNGEE